MSRSRLRLMYRSVLSKVRSGDVPLFRYLFDEPIPSGVDRERVDVVVNNTYWVVVRYI